MNTKEIKILDTKMQELSEREIVETMYAIICDMKNDILKLRDDVDKLIENSCGCKKSA